MTFYVQFLQTWGYDLLLLLVSNVTNIIVYIFNYSLFFCVFTDLLLLVHVPLNFIFAVFLSPGFKNCLSWEYFYLVLQLSSLVAQLVKNLPVMRETWVRSLGWGNPLRRERLPTPVFWPRGHKELDTTEWPALHFSGLAACPLSVCMGGSRNKRVPRVSGVWVLAECGARNGLTRCFWSVRCPSFSVSSILHL